MAELRLKEKYKSQVAPQLKEKFGYKNLHQIPKFEKVVINMSVGDAISNSKALDVAVQELQTISGQKPVITKAKKSIAAFKLREGMNIGPRLRCAASGCTVLDKLYQHRAAPHPRLPRPLAQVVRRGGNYNMGCASNSCSRDKLRQSG